MASCTTALSPSSQHRVCNPVLCSEVHRDGLHGGSMLSSMGLRPQTVDRNYGYSVVQSISRGRSGSSVVPVMPIFKINAAVGDSSSLLPDGVGGENEQTTKDHPSRSGTAKCTVLNPILLSAGPVEMSHLHYRLFIYLGFARVHLVRGLYFMNAGLLQWLRNAVARRSAQKEEMVNNLKRYGVAGVLSYGLLNTAYYLGTFLFVWFYVSPSPGGLGFGPAAQRFLKVFAAVWAGSQVTKLLRAAGALSLAPLVDRGLNWYTQRFNFKSRGTAFSFLVGACFALAALVFLVITTLWS